VDHVTGFRCTICGETYAPDEIDYVCPRHGSEGIVDVLYDYDLIRGRLGTSPGLPPSLRAEPTMWRYLPLLPIEADAPRPPLRVGWTPFYSASRLGDRLGLRHLWVKDDGQNPTASLKDRASALAVTRAMAEGAEVITTASTGNAAAALAGMAASVGMPAVIFVPRDAPRAKIAQHLVYGARVLLVDGTYDEAFDLALRAAEAFGWYNRSTAYNPFMSEGKKTVAYEICEQLEWQAPDRVFVSVGDGCILGAVHKGLRDLQALGWIDRMPRLMGIQAGGCCPLYDAYASGMQGWEMTMCQADTVADSICAGLPRDRNKALAAVRETDGAFLTVSDTEILNAIPVIARHTGVFVEPAASASYAGLVKAVERGLIDPEERIVVLLTGSGLKDIDAAMRTVEEPPVVVPDLAAIRQVLESSTFEPWVDHSVAKG
jgi:threonine synthase